ncbi:P-loop containing nucleoside triphosphate hydrolase protein [Lasiosphaeris hirsuta]|uniref:P-loop containing nucleoside triphosphate hydrolase protein n=1 Tax=Lasiosphaeris hirsuta TaxID=260670 RepID=A0AA40DNT8_9PEZI|nr:P-loop containing nucleoside triphosphate hydrolase protein [Lasiosphaeris hirsuta]
MAKGLNIKKERSVGGISHSQTRRAPSDVAFTERHGASERRGARSGAPSVDTRLAPLSHGGNDEADEGEPMFMEMKAHMQNSRSLGDEPGSQSMQGSFIGPNRALKDFGQGVKDINDALGELQARGIQHVASLPELVLVGDQSSGKSSLMSAIAGLTLPRSSGTCTRCPIHIRISKAEESSCRVYLKKDYEYREPPRPLTKEDVTESNKFPPWVALDSNRMERHEFKTVRAVNDKFDSEEIETVLKCAQVAILNPSTPYQQFIPKLKGEASDEVRRQCLLRIDEKEVNAEAQFSPNTVALEVKGPDLADLNFYDLPGVFMSAKHEKDTFLERVVRNLACQYMARKNAIILWAVPMNQDADNSYAFSLIREIGAVDRCVGVMTKADLLPKEASTSWLSMLSGQAHQTGLGYFITSRQGEDYDQQNAMEEAFFNRTADSTGHWPQIFDRFSDRFGVEKLKTFLSLKLSREFSKVLPEVKKKINDRIEHIEEQLQHFPEPPINPEMEIMTSLAGFSTKVKDRVLEQSFMTSWDFKFMEPFKHRIIGLKPKFNVRDHSRTVSPIVIDLEADSPPPPRKRGPAFDVEQGTPTPKRQRVLQPPATPIKPEVVDRPGIFSGAQSFRSFVTPAMGARTKTLMDIRKLIHKTAIPGQPGLVSACVHEPIYIEAAKTWAPHLDAFIVQTFDFLHKEIMQILDDSFGHLKNAAVYKESLEHMNAFVQTRRTELREQLNLIYKLESRRLFTKDEEALERNKSKENKILVRHRHHFRWAAHIGDDSMAPIRKMEELTEEELAQEAVRMQREAAKMLPDPLDQEIIVAAYVRGYYLTAANRFIDNVAIHVMSGLFPHIASVINTYLHEKLGLTGGNTTIERLQTLISEGPETERRRRELHAERDALHQSMEIIVNLETKGASSAFEPHNGTGARAVGAVLGRQRSIYNQSTLGDA